LPLILLRCFDTIERHYIAAAAFSLPPLIFRPPCLQIAAAADEMDELPPLHAADSHDDADSD